MPLISDYSLNYLKQYKYSYANLGWLDNHVVSPFHGVCVEYMPRWLAPNLITLMSLMHGIIGSTLLIYYCPTLTEAAPQWVYLFYAWCMFMYQTLDGIDGKQARRIGAASPLGQLFDHGCDALCCAFVGLSNCALLRVGSTWYSIAVYLIAIVPFFCSNWEESQTGKMRFGVLGVTEAQLTIIMLHLIAFVCGGDVWLLPVPSLAINCGQLVAWLSAFLVVFGMLDCALAVIRHFRKDERALHAGKMLNHGDHRGGNEHSIAHGLQSLTQVVGALLLGGFWLWADPDCAFSSHPVACLMLLGLLMAYMTSRLIVSHVTNSDFALQQLLLPMPALTLNSCVPLLHQFCSWSVPDAPLLPTVYCVYAYLALVIVVYAHYTVSVVNEITTFLGIRCFIVKKHAA